MFSQLRSWASAKHFTSLLTALVRKDTPALGLCFFIYYHKLCCERISLYLLAEEALELIREARDKPGDTPTSFVIVWTANEECSHD